MKNKRKEIKDEKVFEEMVREELIKNCRNYNFLKVFLVVLRLYNEKEVCKKI